MIHSNAVSKGFRLGAIAVTAASAMWLFEAVGTAQARVGSVAPAASAGVADARSPTASPHERRGLQPIRDSIGAIDYGPLVRQQATGASAQTAAPGRQRSRTRRVIGAAIGATGGFFAGGYLGAAIEGDRCNCDDPGLKGALIGAPIGAVTGGILGGLFF